MTGQRRNWILLRVLRKGQDSGSGSVVEGHTGEEITRIGTEKCHSNPGELSAPMQYRKKRKQN